MKLDDIENALAYYERFAKAGGLTSQEIVAIRRCLGHVRDAMKKSKLEVASQDEAVTAMRSMAKTNGGQYSKKSCDDRFKKAGELIHRWRLLMPQVPMPWAPGASEMGKAP